MRREYDIDLILADIERVSKEKNLWPNAPTMTAYRKWRNKQMPVPPAILRCLGYESTAAGWNKFIAERTRMEPQQPRPCTVQARQLPCDSVEFEDESWPTDEAYAVSSVRKIGNSTYYMLR